MEVFSDLIASGGPPVDYLAITSICVLGLMFCWVRGKYGVHIYYFTGSDLCFRMRLIMVDKRGRGWGGIGLILDLRHDKQIERVGG